MAPQLRTVLEVQPVRIVLAVLELQLILYLLVDLKGPPALDFLEIRVVPVDPGVRVDRASPAFQEFQHFQLVQCHLSHRVDLVLLGNQKGRLVLQHQMLQRHRASLADHYLHFDPVIRWDPAILAVRLVLAYQPVLNYPSILGILPILLVPSIPDHQQILSLRLHLDFRWRRVILVCQLIPDFQGIRRRLLHLVDPQLPDHQMVLEHQWILWAQQIHSLLALLADLADLHCQVAHSGP